MPPILVFIVVTNSNQYEIKPFDLTTSEWVMVGLIGTQWVGHMM